MSAGLPIRTRKAPSERTYGASSRIRTRKGEYARLKKEALAGIDGFFEGQASLYPGRLDAMGEELRQKAYGQPQVLPFPESFLIKEEVYGAKSAFISLLDCASKEASMEGYRGAVERDWLGRKDLAALKAYLDTDREVAELKAYVAERKKLAEKEGDQTGSMRMDALEMAMTEIESYVSAASLIVSDEVVVKELASVGKELADFLQGDEAGARFAATIATLPNRMIETAAKAQDLYCAPASAEGVEIAARAIAGRMKDRRLADYFEAKMPFIAQFLGFSTLADEGEKKEGSYDSIRIDVPDPLPPEGDGRRYAHGKAFLEKVRKTELAEIRGSLSHAAKPLPAGPDGLLSRDGPLVSAEAYLEAEELALGCVKNAYLLGNFEALNRPQKKALCDFAVALSSLRALSDYASGFMAAEPGRAVTDEEMGKVMAGAEIALVLQGALKIACVTDTVRAEDEKTLAKLGEQLAQNVAVLGAPKPGSMPPEDEKLIFGDSETVRKLPYDVVDAMTRFGKLPFPDGEAPQLARELLEEAYAPLLQAERSESTQRSAEPPLPPQSDSATSPG